MPLLRTLESSRVWFDVGGCGVVAYAGVVTLVGLAVGHPTVVILSTTGGWLPRSGGPNHNRVLAAPHHSACDAVVAGHPAPQRCDAVVAPQHTTVLVMLWLQALSSYNFTLTKPLA